MQTPPSIALPPAAPRPATRRAAPPAWPYILLLSLWAAGTIMLIVQARSSHAAAELEGLGALLAGAALVLVGCSKSIGLYFLLGMVAKSITYLFMARPVPGPVDDSCPARPVVVLYLTAGDFDSVAVSSLLRLRAPGPKLFLIHDDGSDEAARRRMELFARSQPESAQWEIEIWHRPKREGGKAGAVNWVLARLDPRWELMLLCDNDSIAKDADALRRALPEFDDPRTAVVQFRNVSHSDSDEPPFRRLLARAIDVFDVFAGPQSMWGYCPFFGHNALLRLEHVRGVGGLTPGFFSDDLDLSVRLTLAERRVVYRRDIAFAERHPADHLSFRKRSRKWALGCTQVVRARAWSVLTARRLPFAHRVGLLEFMGFYPSVPLLLAGLFAAMLVLPWLLPGGWAAPGVYPVTGSIVLLAMLSPTLAWALRSRRLAEWPALAWACILVYGNSLLPTVSGVAAGLSRRERPWIPTNLSQSRPMIPRAGLAEGALGACLLAVPWMCASPELLAPSTYLFIATFLFAPLTFVAYRESTDAPLLPGFSWRVRPATVAATVVALVVAAGATAARAEPLLRVDGDRLARDGRTFQVRGIHYSPWPPGHGPDGRSEYPSSEIVARDMRAISRLGANTVLIHSAPGWVAERALDRGLIAVYLLHITWHDPSDEAFDAEAEKVLAKIESLRTHRGIAIWLLGNEVPRWVVDQLGADTVSRRLASLARRVRELDADRLIGHANWPVTKELATDEFDLVCFNLYPAWPYEVAVRGFGPFLRQVLLPIAGGKPLLITEFGINSLEAGEERQARIIADCWREIDDSRAAGGIVFGWIDEWWKNYDNPIPGKGYWERAFDPTDAERHDDDPEEYYGILRSDRTPKPAFEAVRRMWGGTASRSAVPWVVVGALAVLTVLVQGLARRRPSHEASPAQASEESNAKAA